MWNELEYFYKVSNAGSMTEAAKQIGIHQSSISRKIQKLELKLGYKLLHRTKEGVHLTVKGHHVFKAAKTMHLSLVEAKNLASEAPGVKGKIRISSSHAIANYVLLDLIFEFNQLYPDVTFEIIGNDNFLLDVITNEIDIMISKFDFKNQDNLEQTKLFSLTAGLYASPAYLEKHGEPESVDDLVNHKFISFSTPHKYKYDTKGEVVHKVDWFFDLNPSINENNVALRINNIEGYFKAANEGKGIITSYEPFLKEASHNFKRIVPTIKGKEQAHYMQIPKIAKDLERIKHFQQFLSRKFYLK